MRTAFIDQLIKEAETNEKIFLLVGDLGFSVVEPFAEKFPKQFLNVGIAEQNMTGLAAGLAMEGYNVFTYSIGNFPTLRCMEQIRYDVCYHNLSVKIVSVGGGYAYGPLGVSHHATEEIGMLRTIPNMNICAPGDPVEARQIVSMACRNNEPCYIRLGKAGEPVVHPENKKIAWGDIIETIQGKGTAVFSTGTMLKYSFDYTQKNNTGWGLYSIPFIKPMNEKMLADVLSRYDNIVTIEEHQSSGGFGSAVLEKAHDLLSDKKIKKLPAIKRLAIPDVFIPEAGTQDFLREQAGLLLNNI